MLATNRPYGVRTRNFPTMKIRGLHIIPESGEQWRDMWVHNWDWMNWVKRQIDLSKEAGANALRVMPAIDLYIIGGADKDSMRSHLRQYIEYCGEQDLLVGFSVPIADWGSSVNPSVQTAFEEFCTDIADWPHALHFDTLNEINLQPSSNAQANNWLAGIVPVCRNFCDLPLTASLNGMQYSNAWTDKVDPYVDFHDFHPYYQWYDHNHIAVYKTRSTMRPYLFGEIGVDNSSPTDLAGQWGLALETAQDPYCHGIFAFSIVDYLNFPGIYPTDLSAPRAAALSAFQSWPAWK